MTTNWKEITDPVLKEAAWEREMHFSGMARYEASRNRGGEQENFTDSAVGTKQIQKIVGDAKDVLSESHEEIQELVNHAIEQLEETQTEIIKKSSTSRKKKATIICLDPDTLALLTIKALFDCCMNAPDPFEGAPHQSICFKVARAVEEEYNFQQWIASSKAAAKEYAKEHGLEKTPMSRAEFLLKEKGVVKQRDLRQWQKIFKDFETVRWEDEGDKILAHYCGDALVGAITSAFPDHFEIYNKQRGKDTIKHVRMSEQFQEKVAQSEHNIASMQLVKKPMLTKPKRWEKAD